MIDKNVNRMSIAYFPCVVLRSERARAFICGSNPPREAAGDQVSSTSLTHIETHSGQTTCYRANSIIVILSHRSDHCFQSSNSNRAFYYVHPPQSPSTHIGNRFRLSIPNTTERATAHASKNRDCAQSLDQYTPNDAKRSKRVVIDIM